MSAFLICICLFAAIVAVSSLDVALDCDPCIDRPSYKIKVIVHGTKRDLFWQQVHDAALQAGRDMRVELLFDLYENYDENTMATDIENAVMASTRVHQSGGPKIDALVVTIPSPTVEEAVKIAVKHIPVFGMNSGYDIAEELGLLGFIAMDEYNGGSEAAKQFLSKRNVTKALFIDHTSNNTAVYRRFNGFADTLQQNVVTSNETNVFNGTTNNVEVEHLTVDPSTDDLVKQIEPYLEGCKYDAVLLAGGLTTLEATTSAFYANNCDLSDTLLGSFDTGTSIYDAIAVGKLSFTISQRQYLQGTLSVVLASLYATTGKTLARSSESKEYGIYSSGPTVINLRNLPSDTLQVCEAEAFPVCSNNTVEEPVNEMTGSNKCPCTDRSLIKIGGVLHGITTDIFWDVVFEQCEQAANDLGIELLLERMEPQESAEVWHTKMAQKMISLCQQDIDGLFVTIPSEYVVAAIKQCESLNVPVISVNSGLDIAQNISLMHHISQQEYAAGLAAGKRLLESGLVQEVICLDVEPGNIAIDDRCRGLRDATMDYSEVKHLGSVDVYKDNDAVAIKAIEDAVNRTGDWSGVGLLNTGSGNADVVKQLKMRHEKFVSGTFDLSNEIYKGLDDGLFLFGIDQNPFMQGYIPVWLLTILASTKQHLVTSLIETGPAFIEKSPSNEQKICTSNHFEVCPRPVKHNKNQIEKIRPFGITACVVAGLVSFCFFLWLIIFRSNAVVKKSQPLFLGMVCFGTLLMASAIIPLSIDDSIASDKTCSMACMAAPWLFSIGFTIAFSALFSKIWRINQIMKNSQRFRRVTVRTRDVLLPFTILLTLNIVFMLVWNVVDPMYWDRTEPTKTGDGLESYGYCHLGDGSVSTSMFACLVLVFLLAIVLANVEAYKARNISTEFSESKSIAMVMVCFLQAMLLGIPLVALVSDNPPASYFVKVALIFVICISLVLLIFIPKLHHVRALNKENTKRRMSTTNALRVRVYQKEKLASTIDSNVDPSTILSSSFHSSLSKEQLIELAKRLNETWDDGFEPIELGNLLREFGVSVASNDNRRASFADKVVSIDTSNDQNAASSTENN